MRAVVDVLNSFEDNIYCCYTFERGIRDFYILKQILTPEESKALSTLLVQTDYNNPDIGPGDLRNLVCQDISSVIKYLKIKYHNKIVSDQNIPKNYGDYWKDSCSYKEALAFVSKCQRMS